MNIEKKPGVEIMQAIVRGELPHPTISKTIPMKVVQAEVRKNGFQCYYK